MTPQDLIARLRALGEPNRLAIAYHLQSGTHTATRLLEALPGLSQPSLSRHVRILRDAGLLVEIRRGRESHYQLCEDPVLEAALALVPRLESGQRAEALSRDAAPKKDINTSTSNDVPSEDESRSRGDFQEWLA